MHAVVEEKAWWAMATPIDCVLLSCSFVTNENDLNAEVQCIDSHRIACQTEKEHLSYITIVQ